MSDDATLAQLRQSLGLLQVAFDAASEAMVIVEPGGEVRWGNQAAADLWTNGLAIMLVGRRLEQLLQPLTSSSGVPIAQQAAEHPLQRLKRGDGGDLWHWRAACSSWSGGVFHSLVMAISCCWPGIWRRKKKPCASSAASSISWPMN